MKAIGRNITLDETKHIIAEIEAEHNRSKMPGDEDDEDN